MSDVDASYRLQSIHQFLSMMSSIRHCLPQSKHPDGDRVDVQCNYSSSARPLTQTNPSLDYAWGYWKQSALGSVWAWGRDYGMVKPLGLSLDGESPNKP